MPTPRARLFVPSAAWGGRRRRELLAGAAAIALLAHLAMVAAIVEAPRLFPAFLRTPPAPPPSPPPEAELVMVKQDTPTVGGTPPAKPQGAVGDKTQQAAGGGSPLDAPQGASVPPPAPHDPAASGQDDKGDASRSQAPASPHASNLEVNLDIDGQPGWGLVDPRTIAATPDDHYLNKPAAYPRSAILRGEEGTVYLLTMIAPDGRATSVRIERSSGYPDLDHAARNAIAAWHFRPPMRGGVAVESEMRQAYTFTIGR